MGPISNDNQSRSNRGVIKDCKLLQKGTNYFFSNPKNKTLENAFFHFGLLFESNHYERAEEWKKIYKPIKRLYKGMIDTDTIVSVQLGKDLNNEYNEYEADRYDGYFWKITKAVEYSRPDWAFNMFLGNIQGLLNGGRITEERFVAYFNLCPKVFIQKCKDQIQYNLNFFDEKGYYFKIEDSIGLIRKGKGLYPELYKRDA